MSEGIAQATTILLNRFQFCHILDQNTGKQRSVEGPTRIQLESHEKLIGTWDKIKVSDGQFATIVNPFDEEQGDIKIGERDVRVGPTTFFLHPGEVLEGGKVLDQFVLTDNDALLLRAEKDAPHPLNPKETLHAGEEILLKGPRKFIPHKDVRVKEKRPSIALAEDEGVFVQNDDTGEVRLVQGKDATSFFLEHNESLWAKRLTEEEEQALGFKEQEDVDEDSRVLAAAPRSRAHAWDAVVIELEDNEAICLFEGDKRRVEFGPQKVFLNPHERPKVLFISGGVPVRPNVLRLAKLGLGPDFIKDKLEVRTKDNATLRLDVTFRWRFQIDTKNPEKLFALKDFVGFAAQTLSSEIREAAAKHTFEDFHSKAAEIAKAALFGEKTTRVFEENGLEIFGVDVEGITPEDAEIQKKLSDAIKTNVDIFTRRVQEEAQLESERRLIDGRKKNEEARKTLITLENENARTKALADVDVQAEATKRQAQAEAEATTTRAKADRDAEVTRLKEVTTVLETKGGKAFIELERARVLKETDKVVVPTDSKLVLGVSGTTLDE